jgi:hypothetical protein
MTFLQILKLIAAIATIVTGLISFVRPRSVFAFTGLNAPGARGLTEIRAILGGCFIGLGAAPLLLGNVNVAYQVLGVTYLTIALTRGYGLIVDKSVEQSNIISIVTEIVLGVLLVL